MKTTNFADIIRAKIAADPELAAAVAREFVCAEIDMEYSKRKCWANPDRMLCERNEDGSVTFANDITPDELKFLVTALLKESEVRRQKILDIISCPFCTGWRERPNEVSK